MMTLRDRMEAFSAAFPKNTPAWPRLVQEAGHDVLYATWVLGNDYRNKTHFYGSYPPSYLQRVLALFPDVDATRVLHVFSGSLPKGRYERCDVMQPAEYRCQVEDLPRRFAIERRGLGAAKHYPQLVCADPPYSAEDATRYGTPMVHRSKVIAALAKVTVTGGHLAWLDTVWPIHSKREWVTVGRILVQRSNESPGAVIDHF